MVANFSELTPQFLAVAKFWWLWLPVLLFFLFAVIWIVYVRAKFRLNIIWSVLEIRIPREIHKSPKAMEQFLAGLHAISHPPNSFYERYITGEVTVWFSLEMVSFSGDTHFYLRLPAKYRNIAEALLYAQYPDVEIVEVPDYTETLPRTLHEAYKEGYNVWGTELKLARDDAYPIRTYEEFSSPVEEEQLDPVSALLEILGKMKRGEKLLLQILARPASTRWIKEGLALLDTLRTANVQKKKVVRPTGDVEEVEKMIARTPGETDVLKAVDREISKPGFETIIRYVYLAPKEVFSSRFPWSGVFTCFNQYAAMNMNYFRHDFDKRTFTHWSIPPYVFPDKRLEGRKRRILRNFLERRMPEEPIFLLYKAKKTFILNTEELATVYHLPSHLVLTAPLVKRVASRKMGAPAGLPIFGTVEDRGKSPWDVGK